MNNKLVIAVLACCLLLLIPVTMADTDIGSIRTLYSNDAGSIRNTSLALYADVLRDNQYIGTTDSNGYLYFTMNEASMGVHTFSASVVIGSSYYYGSMVQNVMPSTKDFTMILKKKEYDQDCLLGTWPTKWLGSTRNRKCRKANYNPARCKQW